MCWKNVFTISFASLPFFRSSYSLLLLSGFLRVWQKNKHFFLRISWLFSLSLSLSLSFTLSLSLCVCHILFCCCCCHCNSNSFRNKSCSKIKGKYEHPNNNKNLLIIYAVHTLSVTLLNIILFVICEAVYISLSLASFTAAGFY